MKNELQTLTVDHGKSLGRLNTFGFEQRAEHYAEARTDDELESLVTHARRHQWPVFIIGCGSNIVLSQDVPGMVIKLIDDSIHYSQTNLDNAPGDWQVTASAGVGWHHLVCDTINRGHRGLENLSLIPGTSGAAPVQNIGAYGVELVDRFHSLRAMHLPTGQWHTFHAEDCEFGYRNSIFKRLRGEYAITRITLNLGDRFPLITGYASLAKALDDKGLTSPTAADISHTVCEVRKARLPDPAVIGNAGSFFHNPVISQAQADDLQARFPDMVNYPQADGSCKLAAGWLVDSLGYRGFREGAVGVHDKQALVLVHHGGGTGTQLITLANRIAADVMARYGVALNFEPLVI